MKTKITLHLALALLMVAGTFSHTFADASYSARKNCAVLKRFKAQAHVGRISATGAYVTGFYGQDKGCTYAGPFNFHYYEYTGGSVYCGYAKAYASVPSCYASFATYCGSKFISGALSTSAGTYTLAAGKYYMSAGAYFVPGSNPDDSIGFTSGKISTPQIMIDSFGTPRGKIIIPTFCDTISVKENSDFASLLRVVVWSPTDSLDTLVTAPKVLWEGSARLEHGQLIVSGGFSSSDFDTLHTIGFITDSSGNVTGTMPVLTAVSTGTLATNGLTLDIQTDIVDQLMANNPRQVPLSVIQNANSENVEVKIILAGGFGDFVDDIAPLTAMTDPLRTALFSVSPNPNEGVFSITWEGAANSPTSISILTVQGREVYKQFFLSPSGPVTLPVSLTDLGTGVYLVVISNDKMRETRRVLVE